MTIRLIMCCAIALGLASPGAAQAGDYRWRTEKTVAGLWTDATNWELVAGVPSTTGVPDGPDDTATISAAVAVLVQLDVPVTLTRLSLLGDRTQPESAFKVFGQGSLTFANANGPASLATTCCHTTMSVPVVVATPHFVIDVTDREIVFEAPISSVPPVDARSVVEMIGGGRVILFAAPNTYAATTVVGTQVEVFSPNAGVIMIPGDLTVRTGHLHTTCTECVSDNAVVTIEPDAAWTLVDGTERVARVDIRMGSVRMTRATLRTAGLQMYGGDLGSEGPSATLVLEGDATFSAGDNIHRLGGPASVHSVSVDLAGGQRTFNVASDPFGRDGLGLYWLVPSAGSPNTGLIKTGFGTMTLTVSRGFGFIWVKEGLLIPGLLDVRELRIGDPSRTTTAEVDYLPGFTNIGDTTIITVERPGILDATRAGASDVVGPLVLAGGRVRASGVWPLVVNGSLTATSGVIEIAARSTAAIRTLGPVSLGVNAVGLVLTSAQTSVNFLKVIENDSVLPISGTFLNRPEGTPEIIDGKKFLLTYKGNTGNDVLLKR